MSFRIKGLPAEHFQHLFALSDEELAKQGAVRRIADEIAALDRQTFVERKSSRSGKVRFKDERDLMFARDVALLDPNRFRCGVTPNNQSRSSVHQLRGDCADGSDIAPLVHLLQSVDIACQHVRGLNATLVNGHAFENRLCLKGVRHGLSDRLSRAYRPAMVFVEPDFLPIRTICDTAFAKVFRAAELTDGNRAQYGLRWRNLMPSLRRFRR